VTDSVSPHGMFDRSNQHTWHAWQIKSAHMACL